MNNINSVLIATPGPTRWIPIKRSVRPAQILLTVTMATWFPKRLFGGNNLLLMRFIFARKAKITVSGALKVTAIR